MSWLPDPHQLAEPPELEETEIPYEEAPDYHDVFWEETGFVRPDDTDFHWSFHTSVCRFDSDGDHVSMSPDCPHFETEDQEGPVIRQGWTVQQGRN